MRALAALLLLGLPGPARGALPAPPTEPVPGASAEEPQVVDDDEPPSKKQQLLLAKRSRDEVHALRAPSLSARPALTLRNLWTHELLALDASRRPPLDDLDGFLRDHFTNQATRMDPRLGEVLLRAAAQFGSTLIEVVSGYRSDKYNLMLRKKGHAVARESQHPLGHAVDFRLAGVHTRQLYKFVRSLQLGGAGYYPHSAFVHADVGRVRTWVGN